ncbi:Sodium-dependent glucose transporter 1 [Armadillidium vulgare]|nr:Sodium-dependent glucose transporter 1 [Armadillidium vulgare]
MGENSDDNDPFEEDIVFDQSGLLSNRSYGRQQSSTGVIPTFMLFIRTVFLCVAFVGLGLCASLSQGPVIHLEVAVGIPIQTAFHSFTAHSLGMLIGGILGSILFEVYNRQFLIFVSLLWMSVSVSVLPFTIPVSYWWTLVNLAALGAGLSFLFTGSNVLCLDLWGKQGGASLQSLHFSFALGAFIAPIIIHPFISGSFTKEVEGFPIEKNLSYTPFPLQVTSEYHNNMKRNAENDFTNWSLVTDENIRNLSMGSTFTLPVSLINNETSSDVVNNEGIMNSSTTYIDEGNSTSMNDESTSVQPVIVAKAPKPKPSYTDANLIPEKSKWKRPPQKGKLSHAQNSNSASQDELDKIGAHNQSTTTTTSSVTSTTSTTSTTTMATTIEVKSDLENTTFGVNITSNALKPDLILDNMSTILPHDHTEESTLNGYTLLDMSSNDSSHSHQINSSDNVNNQVGVELSSSLTDTYSTFRTSITKPTFENASISSLSNMETEENLSNSDPEISVNYPLTSASKSSLVPETDKYAIDFTETNYPKDDENRFDIDDFVGQDFTDYTLQFDRNKFEEKASFSEPKVLDLKEYSTKEDEASTISVTASFRNEGTSHSSSQNHQSKPGTFSNVTDSKSRFFKSLVDRFKNYGVTSIHFIYICVGIFLLVNAFISVIIMCHNPREPRSKQDELAGSTLNKVFFLVFSIYMFASEAVEGAVRHLLASSQTENGIPIANKGIDGAALFWGLVCVMRFICILISGCLKLKAGKILVFSTFLTVLGTIFLCIGTFGKEDFLWGGIVVVALGLAPVLPTSFLWMAEHMRVSHRLCAIMIVISSFGNSITHTTLTHVLANSHLYAYILIGISLSAMVFLCISFCLLYRAQNRKTLAVPIGYQLANQEEEETLELTRPNPKTFDNINRRLSEMGEAGQALLID